MSDRTDYVVAVVGGAVAGSEAAARFLAAGIPCILLEQNDRPYGKIEDGLPKWHVKLRDQEYAKIDQKLDHPLLHFVPRTRLGRDVQLDELASWGLSAIVLANGAWRDRSLPVEGVEAYVGKGLYYQNPFTYWFNHHDEIDYRGPDFEVADGMIVVGGGLASIDIVKMLQLETVARALRARGIDADVVDLEHAGIPKSLAKHGLTYEGLGLEGCTLFYRRAAEDMPLADPPDDPSPEQREKSRIVSAKLLKIAQAKYLFRFSPNRAPVGAVIEGERLLGLRFAETRLEGKKLEILNDRASDVRAPFTISSIGSLPQPIPGLPMKGETYDVEDEESGKLRGSGGLYAVGNAVTGKGNINVSYKHARAIAGQMLETYLVGGEGDRTELEVPIPPGAADAAAKIVEVVKATAPRLTDGQRSEIFAHVQSHQRRAGYEGSYSAWMDRVRPKPRRAAAKIR